MIPTAEHGMGRPGRFDGLWQQRAIPGNSKRYDKDKARISFSLPLIVHCSCVQLWESVCWMPNVKFPVIDADAACIPCIDLTL